MARFLILAGATGALVVAMLVAAPHHASANDVSGQHVFEARCAVCHSVTRSGGASIGPHLFGVVGRKAGTLPGFAYSPAMKRSGIVWSEANLKRYIADPRVVVPGNAMPFAGMHNQAQVDALVAYLATLK